MTETTPSLPRRPTATPTWLENAVFYEIYPQSFNDSNGDGIGDLLGIIAKLDYIQSLGINGLWLNPCFESPFYDAGYDISDYYKVAPRYGTNEDLRQLFREAGKRGIRVLLDLVPGHTSIDHLWFQASAKQERNEYSDWFIWTDSPWSWKLDNLIAVCGYGERTGTYITNFFYHQPSLNYGFANPDPNMPWQQPVDAPGPRRVRQELKNIMKFWLDMGASGFRVDMAGSLVKNDPGQRETIKLWQEMRAFLDENYPEAVLVSEWSNPTRAIAGGFHMDFTLSFGMPGYTALLRKAYGRGPGHDPYGFSFFDAAGHGNIMEFLDDYLKHYHATKGRGLIAPITSNHDMNPRLNKNRTVADLKLIYIWLLTMPGTPFIYYGDEIGMRTLDLTSKEGGFQRTGSRTPMQWSETPNAGFSTAPADQLYLPVDNAPDRPTVAIQETDPDSLLNCVRQLISLRMAHPVLQATGDFEVVYAEAGKYPFVYKRTLEAGQTGMDTTTVLVALNPAGYPVEVELPASAQLSSQTQIKTLYGLDGALTQVNGRWTVKLPGVTGGIYQVL